MDKYYNKVAKELGLTKTHVRFIFTHFCSETRTFMDACDNKGILVENFGRFLPHPPTLKSKIAKYESMINNGEISEVKMETTLRRLNQYKHLYKKNKDIPHKFR